MTITGGSALSKEDIDQMVRDAEAHAEEDHKRREEADIRNNGESLAYQTEKFLKDNAEALEKVPAESKSEVEEALGSLRGSLEGADFDAIKSDTERLSTAFSALGTAMYAASGAAEGAPGPDAGFSEEAFAGAAGQPGPSAADDDVVDAEIVDEDEK